MSSSDDDLLPDNSKGKPKAPLTPTTKSQANAATSLKGPTQSSEAVASSSLAPNNADYAAGLLASRRAGLSRGGGGLGIRPKVGSTKPSVSTPVEKPSVSPTLPLSAPLDSPITSILPPSTAVLSSNKNESQSPATATAPPPQPPSAAGTKSEPVLKPQVAAAVIVKPGGSDTATSSPGKVATQEAPPPALDAARVAELRAEIEAKKKSIAEQREKNAARKEQRRQEKIRCAAELTALEQEAKKIADDGELELRNIEREALEAEEAQEKFLRDEKAKVEEAIAAEYRPKIQQLQQQLDELRQREQQLKQTLTSKNSSKDLVNLAVTSAVKSIVDQLRTHFTNGIVKDETWEAAVRASVRKEVNEGFTSTLGAEIESERKEYAKAFEEMLAYWKSAEEEEQVQIARMDEQLLQTLQTVAKEDLERLQREEHAIEEVYSEARQEWANVHRQTLHSELEAAIQRRSLEFEETRSQLQQLHLLRMRDVEERHKAEIAIRKELHEKEMQSLKEIHQQHMGLQDERQKMLTTVQEDAAKATEKLNDVVSEINRLMEKLETYRVAVDENRKGVEKEREKVLEARETSLNEVQELISAHATTIEEESKALSASLVKLQMVQSSLDQVLDSEKSWVAQQLAKLEKSKSDWDREYRRWQHVLAQEKHNTEQRFSDALLDLRDATQQLDEQSRELDAEAATMKRQFAERMAHSEAELSNLRTKEEEIKIRHAEVTKLVADLEVRSKLLSDDWKALHEERQKISDERLLVEREELRMQQVAQNLKQMKANVEMARAETATYVDQARSLHRGLHDSRGVLNANFQSVKDRSEELIRKRDQLTREQRRLTELIQENEHGKQTVRLQSQGMVPAQPIERQQSQQRNSQQPRLATKVIDELRGYLQQQQDNPTRFGQPLHQTTFVSTARPSEVSRSAIRATENASGLNLDSIRATAGPAYHPHHADPSALGNTQSSFHFTQLVGVSEGDTTSQSHQGANSN